MQLNIPHTKIQNKLVLRYEKVNFSLQEIDDFWEKLAWWEKINLLTFFSSDLVKYIHSTNTYLLWVDIMKSKENKTKTETDQDGTKAEENTTENQKRDEEFQVLNALEIFWNINSDNIELLKQNWGCKWDHCKGKNPKNLENSVIHSVDFHVYEVQPHIQGDVLTIKPDFLENILQIWKSINQKFFKEGEIDLPLFKNSENLHKYFLASMKEKKVQTWKEFEMQLTKVVEYKVASMYYAVSKFLYKIS